MTDALRPVARRRVFYIPGYDPIHPRRYRELYRKEAARQAEISGYAVSLTPRAGGAGFGWHAQARIDGQDVAADIDVLVWSDLVRDSMNSSIIATYSQMLRTAWIYISTGTLRRLMRLRKGPVIAALYPVGMLLLQAVFALAAALLTYAAAMWVLGFVPQSSIAGLPALHMCASFGVACVAGMRVLRFFKRLDGKLYAYYLMHDYAFSAGLRGAYPPAMLDRISDFRARIAKALDADYDEVLVVGHSSGAYLAVSVLAELLRLSPQRNSSTPLALLTLGQVVPMVSFLPDAQQLRQDLHELSASDALTWVDVSAPGDGCAFALCDPVSVSGVAPPNKKWPLVFSAAFSESLSSARLAELKHRYFRLHFQYLCAFDQPRDYDYFQITAGPVTLADRYRSRPPSRSRIDHAVSKHTARAA